MEVIVVHEYDYEFKKNGVIGVADNVSNARLMIDKYYGDYKVMSHKDIRDSSIEFAEELRVNGVNDILCRVNITLEWFTLNEE